MSMRSRSEMYRSAAMSSRFACGVWLERSATKTQRCAQGKWVLQRFCYVGQHRTAILVRHGLRVVELPFQAHPDIPEGGIPAGPRNGPMYAMLDREAKEAGLPLNWPPRLPNTRRALAAAEWARRHQPRAFPQFHKDLFDAHFV